MGKEEKANYQHCLFFPQHFEKILYHGHQKMPLCSKGLKLEEFAYNKIRVFISLPNNKIYGWSKLKAFADDIINATEKLKFVLGRVENVVGKGENAGYQHFLLFPQCFQKASFFPRVVESWDCVIKS